MLVTATPNSSGCKLMTDSSLYISGSNLSKKHRLRCSKDKTKKQSPNTKDLNYDTSTLHSAVHVLYKAYDSVCWFFKRSQNS